MFHYDYFPVASALFFSSLVVVTAASTARIDKDDNLQATCACLSFFSLTHTLLSLNAQRANELIFSLCLSFFFFPFFFLSLFTRVFFIYIYILIISPTRVVILPLNTSELSGLLPDYYHIRLQRISIYVCQ